MAELVTGVLIEGAVSKLSDAIIHAINQARYFQPKLTEMQNTLGRITPIFNDMEELNKELDRRQEEMKRFVKLLKDAEDLVRKCKKVNWLIWKKSSYASNLDEMNRSLRDFVQFDLQLVMARNVAEILVEVKKGSDIGSSSGVPLQKGVVIGFKDQLRELKGMVLMKSPNDDCLVIVVSGAGGGGKTTLVTKLCHDPDIIGKFGRNIYFVTVSRTYNKKVIIKSLLGELPGDTDDDVAIQQWGSFLGKQKSEILLVLDDVWSDTVITDFKFKTFNKQYKTYELPPLNDEDATRLFCESASITKHGNEQKDDLVHKLVKCCKNHPLVLSVVGRLLNGTDVGNWEFMREKLLEKNRSVLDVHEDILYCLEKSLYFFLTEPEMKQCYLDLGVFPEDQKIAATTLKDMWVHLYKHDEKGLTTTKTLTDLSSRSLATLSPVRKHLLNYCDEGSVTQHDMMRELAIHLSSREPIEDRERLILNGQDIPEFLETINARILSISTGMKIGERLPSTLNEIQAPKVELFVLNFMTNMHPLPQIMQNMESLKILIITNYGYHLSEIQNFPAPQYLSGLTKIRLDHVSISSISTTILELENLQKLSLIMCKIGNSFREGIPNKLSKLLEIDIDSCDDLVTLPVMLCHLASLKKLSITNCHELTSVSEEFGKLSNLEVLLLTSCTKLPILPESTRYLKKLRIVDLYHCLSMHKLPQHIGELSSLETINLMGCTGLSQHELPKSVEDFDKVKVVCDEEISNLWSGISNVEIEMVEENPLDTFYKINSKAYK